jgi:hypothetical protein
MQFPSLIPGIAGPLYHTPRSGNGCAPRTRRRPAGYGNAARSQDRRAGSARMDPPHHISSPDPGKHCQRFYGAYSNRGRICLDPADGESAALPAGSSPAQDDSDCSRHACSTWARLIKKIFEADSLLCSCGGRMRIVFFIMDPRVVDHILRHNESQRSKAQDPFEPRPPPAAVLNSLQ